MQIVKDLFQVKIVGKCLNKEDIIQLFNFGFSKDNVIKQYKKDNKIKIDEARKIVEKVLYEYVITNVQKMHRREKTNEM